MAKLTFGWGMFRQLLDYSNPDSVQIKAAYLSNAPASPQTVTTGITAHAGGGQTSAVALTTYFNNITTCATAGDSVKLLTATAGQIQVVTNNGATAVDVFPFLGDTINGGSADAAIRLAVGETIVFTCIDATDWKADFAGAGTVGNPSLPVGTTNKGFYQVSTNQLGASVAGALVGGFDSNGIFTGVISEQTSTVGVSVDGTLLKDGLAIAKATPVAINTTAVATAAQIVSGYITSTSAAAVAITTPTATAIAALIGAVQGTYFDLVIDNSAGANTVTLTLDASIEVVTPAVTGGDTLTVSTANAIGVFRLVFTSGVAAKIFRIA